jgi:hypothetical protein
VLGSHHRSGGAFDVTHSTPQSIVMGVQTVHVAALVQGSTNGRPPIAPTGFLARVKPLRFHPGTARQTYLYGGTPLTHRTIQGARVGTWGPCIGLGT